MNSYVERCVVGLYGALLRDFLYVHPLMDNEIKWFESRLDSIIAERGLGFFTITLPDVCKFLERGLADGRLPAERPPYHGARSKEDHRPKFLWILWSLVFDDMGMLRSDANIEAIRALRQLYLFAKKVEIDCSEEKVHEAFSDLVSVDKNLPTSHPDTWDSDIPCWLPRQGHPLWGESDGQPDYDPLFSDGEDHPTWDYSCSAMRRYRRWDVFRELCFRVMRSMGSFDMWGMRPKHGPGAISDAVRFKYDSPHWPRKLSLVCPPDWFWSHDLTDRTTSTREFPCKVIAVPKTQKGPRIIAAEPTAHQWIQGGIQRWMTQAIRTSRILRHSIDLNDQTPSQILAKEGSMTGSLATVDLSAASDRLSTRLVEFVFQSRHDVLDVMHASRSRLARMPDGEQILLRKFAMMGSACTFPVQTIVFTCLSLFSLVELSGNYKLTDARLAGLAKQVRVFGDDIIVPAEAYDALEDILTDVLLKVNPHKSFWTGLFRESCGMDAYGGHDVTPAYFRQPYSACNPESLLSLCEVSNNFYEKGRWNAAEYLRKTIDSRILSKIRVSDRDVSQPYLLSYEGIPRPPKVRWNEDLHRLEGQYLLNDSAVKRIQGSGEAALLQYFTEDPDPSHEYEHGQAQRPKHRLVPRWVALSL